MVDWLHDKNGYRMTICLVLTEYGEVVLTKISRHWAFASCSFYFFYKNCWQPRTSEQTTVNGLYWYSNIRLQNNNYQSEARKRKETGQALITWSWLMAFFFYITWHSATPSMFKCGDYTYIGEPMGLFGVQNSNVWIHQNLNSPKVQIHRILDWIYRNLSNFSKYWIHWTVEFVETLNSTNWCQ